MLTPEREQQVDELLTRYPIKRSAVIPVLWLVQEQYGWISLDAMKYVAQRLSLTPEQVREVVTFYSMFYDRPMGTYSLQVCCTTPCMLLGSDDLIAHIEKKLGIKRGGEITPDGLFSVHQVECLGSCDTAPMLQVNRERYNENLTPERVDALIEELRARAGAKGNGGAGSNG
jgi:NADH-quinone oxidoreductase subunit E